MAHEGLLTLHRPWFRARSQSTLVIGRHRQWRWRRLSRTLPRGGTLKRTASLVQSDQKDGSFGRGGVVSDGFGALAVVIEDPDPYPPVPGRTAESQHPGGAVTVAEAVDQLVGGVLVVKRADLYRPTSAGVEWDRSLEHFDSNQGDTRLPHVNLLRRGQGQIEN